MLQLPREPQSGEFLTAAFGRQVIRYLRAITPKNCPGFLVQHGPNGTTFVVTGRAGGSTMVNTHPFQVVDASDEGGAKVSVVFGQVNSITPTIGGDALDTDPAPVLAVDSGVVYLAVVLDVAGAIVSASIHNDEELPAADATHGYLTLATVAVGSGSIDAISQAVTHSLGMRRCGVSDIHFWGI